jgi:preprotein translocase subunit YajC
LTQLFPLLLLLVVGMILFSVLGQRRDRKKREAMIKAVKKHDRVQTIGGVIGSIVEVKSNTVVLKVDESSNTRITFARSAVQQVLTAGSDSEGETTQ